MVDICQVPWRFILQSLHTKIKMKVFLSLQQILDILHEADWAPGIIRSTACKYNVDLVQIRWWKKNLAGMDGDAESSEVLYISSKGQAKRTLHNGKSRVDAEHYGAIHLMFDTFRAPGYIVSVMMLTVELQRISGTPVSLHVLSKHMLAGLSVLELFSAVSLMLLRTLSIVRLQCSTSQII